MIQQRNLWLEDLESILHSDFIDFDRFQHHTLLITGANGLIGKALCTALLHANRAKNLNLHVIAMGRDERRMEEAFSSWMGEDLSIVVQDITSPLIIDRPIDDVFHCASPTDSSYFVKKPVETIWTALDGTRNVLDFAARTGVKSVVYLSSLEVYGNPGETAGLISESMFGMIDPMSVRSSYSEGKRMAECCCAAYASEYGVPVKVVRLSQTMGPGINKEDRRVFAQFVSSVLDGKDIVLVTEGKTRRNYTYLSDAVTALLTIAIRGKSGEAYNVANEDTAISIADMAKLAISVRPQSASKLVFDLVDDAGKLGYNPVVNVCLDTGKLRALGWEPKVALREMFLRMMEDQLSRLDQHG